MQQCSIKWGQVRLGVCQPLEGHYLCTGIMRAPLLASPLHTDCNLDVQLIGVHRFRSMGSLLGIHRVAV
jgi:hypothetical protein